MLEAPPAIIFPAEPSGISTTTRGEGQSLLSIRRHCDSPGSDIVVCGRRDEFRYRIQALPRPPLDRAREQQIPFGIDLSPAARLGPTVSQVQMPGGFISQRIMMTLRVGF